MIDLYTWTTPNGRKIETDEDFVGYLLDDAKVAAIKAANDFGLTKNQSLAGLLVFITDVHERLLKDQAAPIRVWMASMGPSRQLRAGT